MDILLSLLKAFAVGGLLCALGEILILSTKLTSARILVAYVTAGVILGALGIYEPIAEFAGAGATVPLTGFGYTLAKGVEEAVKEKGLLGVLTGSVTGAAGGITAAVVFSYLVALVAKSGDKS